MGLRTAVRRGAAAVAEAPIVARVLGAIGLLAVLVAIAFAIVLVAMSNLRNSTDEQVQANKVTSASLALERVVDKLEQSLRSYLLTRNPGIRADFIRARSELPAAIADLRRNVAAQPGQT